MRIVRVVAVLLAGLVAAPGVYWLVLAVRLANQFAGSTPAFAAALAAACFLLALVILQAARTLLDKD